MPGRRIGQAGRAAMIRVAPIHHRVEIVAAAGGAGVESRGRLRSDQGKALARSLVALQRSRALSLADRCPLPQDWTLQLGGSLEHGHSQVHIPRHAWIHPPADLDPEEYANWWDLATPVEGQLRVAWRACLETDGRLWLRAYLDSDYPQFPLGAFGWSTRDWHRPALRPLAIREIPEAERRARGLIEYESNDEWGAFPYEGPVWEAQALELVRAPEA